MMRADEARVHWHPEKKKWQVVIQVGAEVIKRWANRPRDAAEESLRSMAVETAKDEGYDLDAGRVSVGR